MKQLKINDKIDIIISELNDNSNTIFEYDGEMLKPNIDSRVYVWINGIPFYSKEKDLFEIEDFEKYFIGQFKECKDINDVIETCEIYDFVVSDNIYDLIPHFEPIEEASFTDFEKLKQCSIAELKDIFAKKATADFVDLGTYFVFIND